MQSVPENLCLFIKIFNIMPSPRVDSGEQWAAIGRQQLSVNTRAVFPMGGEHILKILCKKLNFLENLAFKLCLEFNHR